MNNEKLEGAKNLLFIALGIDIAVTAVVVITDLLALNILHDVNVGVSTLDQINASNIDLWASFSTTMILTMIGVGCAISHWLGKCYEYSKETLRAKGFVQEGWKTWGWIVPGMDIFKPYQVLSEVYKMGAADSEDGKGWKKSSGSGMLLGWWIFWVTAHAVMWGVSKQLLKARLDDITLKDGVGMYYVSIAACVISLVVAGLWFVVAGSLTRRLLNRSVSVADSTRPIRSEVTHQPTGSLLPSRPRAMQPDQAPTSPDQQKTPAAVTAAAVSDEELWARALAEVDSAARRPGLWAKQRCFPTHWEMRIWPKRSTSKSAFSR